MAVKTTSIKTPEASVTDISALPGLSSIWSQTWGNSDICIAVLDGPVDQSHPCFEGAQLTPLQTLVSSVADQGAASQHGTHVASLIFGQRGSEIAGIAPGCRGLIVPVFSDGEKGSIAPCSQVDLARAITQAVEQGANVINISGGQLTASGEAGQWLTNAINLCADNNVLIVAAAGNDGCACLHLPAALPTVLAVGAMDAQGLPLDFSNWGDTYQSQGILAIGENLLGAVPGGGTASRSGTSFATPVVSGIVALLLSLQLQQGKKPDPLAIRAAILDSAIPCQQEKVVDCRRFLVGRLNLPAATNLTTNQQRGTKAMSYQPEDSEVLQPSEVLNIQEAVPDQHAELAMPQLGEVSSEVSPSAGIQAAVAPTVETAITTIPISSSPIIAMPDDAVTASGAKGDCGCGGGGPMQFVYVTGTVGYDFGTEARRDSIVQDAIGIIGEQWNPNDPSQLLAHLAESPWEAAAIIWTLNQENTPIYAIQPAGNYGYKGYELLRQFLRGQVEEGVERVSIPGSLAGSVKLFSGQTVPRIVPSLRGMYSWNTNALVEAVVGARPAETEAQQEHDRRTTGIHNFLERIYYELRNLGLIPQERALNYAATNAFQIARVYEQATQENMELDAIAVEKSPLCRPESDCWDVKLTFFNPRERYSQAKKVYRFTVDVSDIVPVTIGSVRSWYVY